MRIYNLSIFNQATGQIIPIPEVDGAVTTKELLAAYLRKINLPADTRGIFVRKLTNKQLLPSQTLHAAGLEDNETLVLDLQRMAYDVTHAQKISGLFPDHMQDINTIYNLYIVNETTRQAICVESLSKKITADELLAAYANKINLPAHTRGVLVRKFTHKQISPNQTLEDAGVTIEGEVLIAEFERTAGGGIVISSYRDIQLIDTYFNREQVLNYHSFALSAIILYTAADKNLSQFIKENFKELHYLAGNRFIFYIVERPDPVWIPLMRKELGDELGPHIERVWNILDKGEFSPVDGSIVYEIVNRFGIKRNLLPCICFFTNLQHKELVVLPLSSLLEKSIDLSSYQDFLNLFRDLLDKVDVVANYPERERLQQIQREITKIRNGKAISMIEKVLLPEAIESAIGAVVKLLLG
jgi:hypothetical protein